eukprot:TRINITY_DN619_c0_g2_i1.p3 TRINITY_DN619_c0_g2~~TRINITY_DN619_c0_g2_i1.p3  ORF type:complete len:119 (+),score=28.77 TRINITY_DN619_c0_g2_i1:83-439(+)
MTCGPTSAAQRAEHVGGSRPLAPVPSKPADDTVIPALETDSDEEELECPPPPKPTLRRPGLQQYNLSGDDADWFLLPCVSPRAPSASTTVHASQSPVPSLLARLFGGGLSEGAQPAAE